MKKLTLGMMMIVALSGCASKGPTSMYQQAVDFDAASHVAYERNDNAELRGSAYIDQWTCAGGGVFLLPKTAYFMDLMRIDHEGSYVWPSINSQAQRLVRFAPCSIDGAYQLSELPQADWIMVAMVPGSNTWMKRYASTRANTLDEVSLIYSDAVYQAPAWEPVVQTWIPKQHPQMRQKWAHDAGLPWGAAGDK